MNVSGISTYSTYQVYLKDDEKTNKLEEQQKEEEKKSVYAGDWNINNKEDSVLSSLHAQLEKNERDLQKLSENDKLSTKEKLEKKRVLEQEKEAIQAEIVTRQLQLKKEEKDKQEKEIKENLEKLTPDKEITKQDEVLKDTLQALTQASGIMEEASTLSRLRVMKQGELRIAEAELKQAMAYRPGSSATQNKQEAVADAKIAMSQIDSDYTSKLGELNELAKEQAAAEKNPEEKEEKQKNNQENSANTISWKDINFHVDVSF